MASLQVTRLPAFSDNYLWLIHGFGDAASKVAVVDPGDANVVNESLEAQSLSLAAILVTHHHRDHTGGVAALSHQYGCPVYGPATENIPEMCFPLREGDAVNLAELGLQFQIMHVPGHTAGHITYVGHGALFCGDTLFSGGCGRLFEGTAEQMLDALTRFAALPDDTAVYCAHEYTAANLKFALAVEPSNRDLAQYADEVAALRGQNIATIPSKIRVEKAINPFLRTHLEPVCTNVWREHSLETASPVETFRLLREWKNRF